MARRFFARQGAKKQKYFVYFKYERALPFAVSIGLMDGGASCGMYYNGTYFATPGRELTVTRQVFPK